MSIYWYCIIGWVNLQIFDIRVGQFSDFVTRVGQFTAIRFFFLFLFSQYFGEIGCGEIINLYAREGRSILIVCFVMVDFWNCIKGWVSSFKFILRELIDFFFIFCNKRSYFIKIEYLFGLILITSRTRVGRFINVVTGGDRFIETLY